MGRDAILSGCLLAAAVCAAGCNPSQRTSADSAVSRKEVADEFLSLMNAGKNYLDRRDATNALAIYRKAERIAANSADLRLNIAISYLLAGDSLRAVREADEVLKLESDSAAAYFIKGSAYLRESKTEEAVKAFENAKKIDPGETATWFQLGLARMGLNQWEAAISAFREGIGLDPNRLHAAPHYLLAQALRNAGREEEAMEALKFHQANLEGGAPQITSTTFERSKFLQARVPFKLDQPESEGVRMTYVDATREVLGDSAQGLSGPIGLIDPNHSGRNSLFALEGGRRFRLLWNSNGVFRADEAAVPAIEGASYAKLLVGDLQNDRFDDVIALGEKGSQVFKFGTNGFATDVSESSSLRNLNAVDGVLVDLDFTGKLDLVAVTRSYGVQLHRQFGPLSFREVTASSGIPQSLRDAESVLMSDWNRDENMDLIIGRRSGSPMVLEKRRGGPLAPRETTHGISGTVLAAGDFDNDLRADLVVASPGKITLRFNGGAQREIPVPDAGDFRRLLAIDYDNDGWLDLWGLGEKTRAWRNVGASGFKEQTRELGLDQIGLGRVSEAHFADFDLDCDSDVVIALADGGLRYLRNEGGNANSQVKVRLYGNRSNAGGLGCKVEIEAGGLRLMRTVDQLPVEIGVGKNRTLDSFLVHWFNWPQGSAELAFDCREPILALELTLQEGSCPYLYAWDGQSFRFITDILGAAPLGLPVSEGRYIESDPEELVWIGNAEDFRPNNGMYQVRITEELREVLYLDEAKLVVVDREAGAEVHSTDKLLPRGPFRSGEIMTLHREHPLRSALTFDGREVADPLRAVDGKRVSPPKLRAPQLRGLAEPHGLILDFGPLDVSRPLALVMNGWLRFGGGMANIAASQDPELPFPFPTLEAEVAPGNWKTVDVVVGAPAGKTKTIVADLEGKLEPRTQRLRMTQAFEIHWDRIALLEKKSDARTKISYFAPSEADLHFRGFSRIRSLPQDEPPTPDYDAVRIHSPWTILPGGWCTRYGDVSELVASRDEALALIHSGDELTLKFSASALPAKPPGTVREFFLYLDGWDKDADFHVAAGTEVEPLPFHGMNDQLYGRENRPPFPSDALHKKYNIRWVESRVLQQAGKR